VHLDGILERRAGAAKDRGIDRAGDRNDVEIECRRKAAAGSGPLRVTSAGL